MAFYFLLVIRLPPAVPVGVKVNTHYLVEHFVRKVREKSTFFRNSSRKKCVQLEQDWKGENVLKRVLHTDL